MENREQQILSEIKSLISSVRMQIEQLDAKMAELQQACDPQEFDAEPLDIDLPFDLDIPSDDVDAVILSEQAPESEPVLEPEPVPEPLPETVSEPTPDSENDPEPLFMVLEDIPETVFEEDLPSEKPAAVIDVMTFRHAWRIDMPGSAVKDIRAAIALVDRALFINRLFAEDAMAFMDTLNHINQLNSLDEAVEYLASSHPEWDFDSDVVYRFMMAVRRKINQ